MQAHFRKKISLALLYLLIGSYFCLNYIRFGKPFMDWNKYIDLSEKLPYQGRILMAFVYAFGEKLFKGLPITNSFGSKIPGLITNPDHALILFLVTLVSFIACCFSAHYLRNKLFVIESSLSCQMLGGALSDNFPQMCMVFMIFSVYILNPNLNFILPYDIPSLAFQFILLSMIISRSPAWLVLFVFSVATLNRETTLFVCLFLFVATLFQAQSGLTLGRYAKLFVGTTFVWISIRLILRVVFLGVPSDEGSRLILNVGYLLKGYHLPAIIPLLFFVGITYNSLVCYWQNSLSRNFERAHPAWPAAALTAGLGLALLCNYALLIELRAFGDLIPYVYLSLCYWIHSRANISSINQ